MELAKAETQAVMAQVVDSKLTRSELLDIIIAQVDTELVSKIAELETERDATKRIAVRDIIALAREKGAARVKGENERWNQDESEASIFEVSIACRVKREELPPKVVAILDQRRTLSKQISEAKAQRQRLNNGKREARLAMLRESLQSTPEGQKIMAAIEGFKETVKARLLGAAS